MSVVVLKRGRANPLWHGHPWVFSGAVAREDGAPGEVVEVRDAEGRFIGRGHYNPRSQIRVRVLTTVDEPIDAAFFARRVAAAVALRKQLGLPSEATNAYRLINSEGDGLAGVIADVYNDVVAVQLTTLGAKLAENTIFDAIEAAVAPRAIVEVAAGGVSQLEGFTATTRVARGAAPGTELECREESLRFTVDPLGGQKTGLFLDQRENRQRIRGLAHGARVLDVYSYVGGFALAALKGGAVEATCVDASARALERATAHAALNGLGPLTTVESDAFRFLETATPRRYDLVILDPPKFARAKKDLEAATKGYARLNLLGINAVADGGLLATASCSGAIDAEAFERIVATAARDAGRRVQVLVSSSQGPDHPLPPAFPEGRYLKFLLCRVV